MRSALLVSTYEMGRQPFGLASAAAWLRAEGLKVTCVDAAREKLADRVLGAADLIAFHLPMHTATRLAAPVIVNARRLNPSARICAFGLYGPLNADWLRSIGVDEVFGGEFEEDLAQWAGLPPSRGSRFGVSRRSSPELEASGGGKACTTSARQEPQNRPSAQSQAFSADSEHSVVERDLVAQPFRAARSLPKIHFLVPDRTGLPPLSKYATLQMPDGERRLVGYTEASRGCRHLCRHCPVVPIYNGQFRVVQQDVVLADAAAQIAAGAHHITFGDPDFFNGPTHAMRIVEALHAAHPDVTYDATIKVEHLRQHRDLLPPLRATRRAFVISAVESLDDRVLALFDKWHTRQDFFA